MDAYVLDWVNLLLRWSHVIVAIAWIGASFYFVFLDNSLTVPTDPVLCDKGVDGELWAVHGGGFYNPQKYKVSPKTIPEHLHWFYWESYFTWITGFALFTTLYLWQARTFLIDPNVHVWSPPAAIAGALGFLLVFWLVYDAICSVFGRRAGGDRVVGICVAVFVVFAAWLACRLFAGRAAFLLVGAMLGTAMSANVLVRIIPGQRKVIEQMKAGQPVNPVYGQIGKQRSVHNTYFTLPVVVAMISNHYGFFYGAPYNWLVLVLVMLAGALIRHSFVARHLALVQGRRVPWEHAVIGCVVLAAVAVWIAPAPQPAEAASTPPPTFAQAQAVVTQRCVVCHNAQYANKDVRLDTKADIERHAQQIYQQAVVLKLMPLNNATQITDAERRLLGRWFEAGAPSR